MKTRIALSLAATLLSAAAAVAPARAADDTRKDGRIPAVRLYNLPDGRSAFARGTVPSLQKIDVQNFWFSSVFEEWQKGVHPAPRNQYVISLKGKLRFKVSDGSTFVLEPGTVLLAEDTRGEGHSWEILDGNDWSRLYVPYDGNSHFHPE